MQLHHPKQSQLSKKAPQGWRYIRRWVLQWVLLDNQQSQKLIRLVSWYRVLIFAIGPPALKVRQAKNTISQPQEDIAMIGTPAFSAPTGVALCYFQCIFSPLHLQTVKWSARQSPSTQVEFYSFSLALKSSPGGHGKRLLNYLCIFSRWRARFLILIRNLFRDRRLWRLRFPQIFNLVTRGKRGGFGKRSKMPSCTFNATRSRHIVRASHIVSYRVVYAADQKLKASVAILITPSLLLRFQN